MVTSTAALAAQRLGHELSQAGVDCIDYSTVGLTLAARNRTLTLGPDTTVIHDEAALASTRELQPLTELIESSGGRLILVGDPHQSQPVGSGGLWPHLEQITTDTDAHAQLTHNVRARDPADRHDQARFRAGEHEAALRGYHERGRLHVADEPAVAEDAALDAAHADRQASQRTVVITQTSNDHLDALNARAQALRLADGELGESALELDGRPYQLRSGDDIQLRRTIHDPNFGPLRNGTHATVTAVDSQGTSALLHLNDGQEINLTKAQLDTAQARLAYVQHPFPAQGITTDTAHLIIGDHVSHHGTYVGLTRAREHTDIYDGQGAPRTGHEAELIAGLAQHAGRGETDRPSIAYAMLQTPTTSTPSIDPERDGTQPAKDQTGPRVELESDPTPERRWPKPPEVVIKPQEHDNGWEW